jgi:hypothetical protein
MIVMLAWCGGMMVSEDVVVIANVTNILDPSDIIDVADLTGKVDTLDDTVEGG